MKQINFILAGRIEEKIEMKWNKTKTISFSTAMNELF